MITAKDFRIFFLLLEPALTSKFVTLWGWGIKKSLGIFSVSDTVSFTESDLRFWAVRDRYKKE
jgi:hypothetical protein